MMRFLTLNTLVWPCPLRMSSSDGCAIPAFVSTFLWAVLCTYMPLLFVSN
eukprot:m.170921 g.170921  ORF g.170921 m.170921 type:complete len:50 (+) comp16491_c0_seq1:2366-2515(+)